MEILTNHQRWLDDFLQLHGRAPRILHIGNIANNAYNNAKLLNEAGFDCDVICYDYYHIMGSPEWEEVDLDVSILDPNNPDWLSVDLGGYERPRWFAQGPMALTLDYLIARNSSHESVADLLWRKLLIACRLAIAGEKAMPSSYSLPKLVGCKVPARVARRVAYIFSKVSKLTNRIYRHSTTFHEDSSGFDEKVHELIKRFSKHFPDRLDKLTDTDLQGYRVYYEKWKKVIDFYDVVIGYSTDGIYPLIADKRPYIAFEHGTIRDIPFEKSAIGRIASIVYAEATAVYLTNADSLPQADKLHVRNPIYGPHGFNPSRFLVSTQTARDPALDTRFSFGSGVKVFFAPARHHWKEGSPTWRKGNDRVIHAAARLAKTHRGRFHIVFIEWGNEVHCSKKLIDDIGVNEYFTWMKPMPKAELFAAYLSVDCIVDQFILPCIGSVTLDAIALGLPVMTSLDNQAMTKFFGEPLELLNCRSVEEITEIMKLVIEEDRRIIEASKKSHSWFERNHSEAVLSNKLFSAIRISLDNSN